MTDTSLTQGQLCFLAAVSVCLLYFAEPFLLDLLHLFLAL